MSVGSRIRELRLKSDKTQRDVCKDAGLAVAYLSRLENGRISPSIRTLSRLATALEVPLNALFDNAESLEENDRCPVSISGKCILEHVLTGRGRRPKGLDGYTRDQLELLRQFNFLMLKGGSRTHLTLATMVGALMESRNKLPAASEEAAAPPSVVAAQA